MNDINKIKTKKEKQLELFRRETFKAWLAGFFDGDGCVSVTRQGRHHKVYIQISNTYLDVLKLIQEVYGGSIYAHKMPKDKPHWKKQYGYKAHAKVARAIIDDIYPYVIIKKARVEIAIRLMDTFECADRKQFEIIRTKRGRPSFAIKDSIMKEREKLMINLHELNKKGVH